jgi:phage virion morphogenesis protein
MTGARITVEIHDAPIRGYLNQLRFALSRPEELTEPIGVRLRDNTQDRFASERAPDGTPWQRLNPLYDEIKRGPGILRGPNWSRSGLNNSITHEARGCEVVVGSNKVYAAIHQFGGTIRPKKPGGLLMLRTAGGAIWGAAKDVTIPARPFLGLSEDDRRDVLDIIADWHDRAAQGGRR